MIKYADRVLETSTSQGTGTINLAGATAGFQSFVAGVGNGNKCVYFIEDGVDWEAGVGTVTAGPPDTLSRDRILESSNSGAAVDWGPGTRNVFLGASSHALLWRDENGNDTNETGAGGGTANAQTVTYPNERAGYSDGMLIRWIATVENTGAMTVNVNGLGAKSYVQNDGTAFAAGQVPIGSLQQAVYDLANDRFMSLGATTAAGITIDDAGFVVFTATNLQDFADEVDALADGVAKINVKATDIATAATVNLDASTGDYVALTGTTTVTAITLAEGQERTVRAAGAFVLTHGANLILPTGANITTASGDVFIVRGEGAGVVRIVDYQRANGQALAHPAAPSKDFELISVTVASNSATLDIALPSGYSEFETVGKNLVPVTNQVDLYARVSVDNGTTVAASSGDYRNLVRVRAAASLATADDSVTTAIPVNNAALTGSGKISNVSGRGGISFNLRTNSARATGTFQLNGEVSYRTGNNDPATGYIAGNRDAAAAVNLVRFLMSSGNINSGTIYLYGKKV